MRSSLLLVARHASRRRRCFPRSSENNKGMARRLGRASSSSSITADIDTSLVASSNDDIDSHYIHAFSSTEKYDWSDPFLLYSTQLTEDERLIQESARQFCQTRLQPHIVYNNRHEITLDHTWMQELGTAGLLGSTLPTEYGGSGLSYVSYGLLTTELERVDSSYRSAMSVQSSLVMHPIFQYAATEQLKRSYLPELAAGRLVGCFGLTEANHGSDPGRMETKSVWDAGTNSFVLNGSKNWITNSPIADVFVVWAKNQDGKIKGYLVDKGNDEFGFIALAL
jgi:glutaryl-CoA dehydrogenase